MPQAHQPVVGACAALLLSLASLQAQNTVVGTSSGVGSGNRNLIYNSSYAWIGGGFTNVIVNGANFSTIGGGYSNTVRSGAFSTLGGGSFNLIQTNSTNGTIAGGERNVVSGLASTIGGGRENRANGNDSVIGGGVLNQTDFDAGTVAGGSANKVTGFFGTVGGGLENTAGPGDYATVPGGYANEASALASFAAGTSANADHSGAFVWSSGGFTTASTNANSFTARAPGGARFITTSNSVVGAILAANATSWAVLSDSNAKTGVHTINPRQILAKVAALPVTSWQYKHDPARTYIGPMAQDFHAAFGLGADDKTITTLDTDGVTLAAIKGLVEELKERDAEIAGLKARNGEIEGQLRQINERLDRLPPAP